MSDGNKPPFLKDELLKRTSVLGLRLWVVLGICVGATIVIILFLISLWFSSRRNKKTSLLSLTHKKPAIPNVSREIQEIRPDPKLPLRSPGPDEKSGPGPKEDQRVRIEIGKGHRMAYPENVGEARPGGETGSGPEVSHLGWGHWYTLRELEAATTGFAAENVIGEGGYGIVYHGVFEDNSRVAVKNLLNNSWKGVAVNLVNIDFLLQAFTRMKSASDDSPHKFSFNRGQAEREFKVEVEAIGRVRHKNLVRLLGFCAEGAHRMLVYEYVDNGNLEQWLHGDVGPRSPLTWDIRMLIILGTAKGLTYLHEGLEPKVVHRDIKASNILLDRHWNSKVSDFGLAKLIGSEKSYITTRVMGTFGYVAPEYASTGMLNERSDVYSFGILIMEIITGRNPVDYSRPPGEVNLVDWLKTMVSCRNAEGILDPKLPETPSSRALKRTLLVALRCVDPNAQKRPKMGQVVHMLEADDFPFRTDERGVGGLDKRRIYRDGMKSRGTEKRISEPGDSSGYESSIQTDQLSVMRHESDEEK